MPTAVCKCGRTTNSTTSNYWETHGKPTQCYAAHDGEKWVKGCSLGKADPSQWSFALKLIRKEFKELKITKRRTQ